MTPATIRATEITPLANAHSVQIGNRVFPFTTCEHVSASYTATIERLGVGGSQTPNCHILDESGERIGHVSYNGRVWDYPTGRLSDYQPGRRPIYAPNGFYGDPQDLPRIDGVPQYPTMER